jgi:hypothetical protein
MNIHPVLIDVRCIVDQNAAEEKVETVYETLNGYSLK